MLLLVTLLIVALLGAGSAMLWQRAAAFNNAVSTEPAHSSKLWGALGGHDQVNLLLLGHSPEYRDGAFLTDSIAILSIDPTADTTTAISIPRDLWVEGSSDMPLNGKINEAFAIGYRAEGWGEAGDRAARVVSYVTGLPIQGWIAIDFDGFRQMVDAVDGIVINNPTSFSWALGAEQQASGSWSGTFPVGPIAMDGMEALQYTRVRYTDVVGESSDFARSARQQRVLAAIKQKIDVSPAGVGRLLDLMDTLDDGHLHTNISVFDLVLLSRHLTPSERVELAEDQILEATTNTIGQYILVVIGRSSPVDYAPLHAYIDTELSANGGT